VLNHQLVAQEEKQSEQLTSLRLTDIHKRNIDQVQWNARVVKSNQLAGDKLA
jgi:hypothetical protein